MCHPTTEDDEQIMYWLYYFSLKSKEAAKSFCCTSSLAMTQAAKRWEGRGGECFSRNFKYELTTSSDDSTWTVVRIAGRRLLWIEFGRASIPSSHPSSQLSSPCSDTSSKKENKVLNRDAKQERAWEKVRRKSGKITIKEPVHGVTTFYNI